MPSDSAFTISWEWLCDWWLICSKGVASPLWALSFASSLCHRLEVAICASWVLQLTQISVMSLMLQQGTSLIATVIKAIVSHISDCPSDLGVYQELQAKRLTGWFRLPLPYLLWQISHVWPSVAIPMLCSKLRTCRVSPQTTILSNVQNK